MSKSFYFANEEELRQEILKIIHNDSSFRQEVTRQMNIDLHDHIEETVQQALQNQKSSYLETHTLHIKENIIVAPVFSMSSHGILAENYPIRIDNGVTRMNADFLNVDQLFIQGRKVNLVQNNFQGIQVENNNTWT